MPSHLSLGGPQASITPAEIAGFLDDWCARVAACARRVLLLPPDITRMNSRAGELTEGIYRRLSGKAVVRIMPALGTHFPMTRAERHKMFGAAIPDDAYLEHRWKDDLRELGEVPGERIAELSEGKLDYAMEVAVNRELFDGGYDLIVSIGQVVPHEVIGMANYTKNVMVGVGGRQTINKSHFLGAVYGMERIMGRADTPVRRALNEGYDRFLRGRLPIQYLLTVVEKRQDDLHLRGLYAGEDDATFLEAAELCRKVNLDLLDEPIAKAVVFLDPEEFKSTWLGNKAVYRTRMAMADGGELFVLAPALHTFGEDPEIDRLIRRYGYRGTEQTLRDVRDHAELANNLSAAAHLIHGTSDGRFRITYCPGPGVTEAEVRSVGFDYLPYEEAVRRFRPEALRDGWNEAPGEGRLFYVSNPALGLWALKRQFA